jgi:hypothetical protein
MTTERMTDEQKDVRSGLLNEAARLKKVAKVLRDSMPSVADRLEASAAALETHATTFQAKDAEIATLKADNAVVLADLRTMHEVAQDVMRHEERERIRYAILDRMEKPHPGAALLEEHKRALQYANDKLEVAGLAYATLDKSVRVALVRARNEGLEKALAWLRMTPHVGRATILEIERMKEPEQ